MLELGNKLLAGAERFTQFVSAQTRASAIVSMPTAFVFNICRIVFLLRPTGSVQNET